MHVTDIKQDDDLGQPLGDAVSRPLPLPRSRARTRPSSSNDQAWLENDFIPTVQQRGAAIIEARGLSSAASAANAAVDHVRDWALGTASGRLGEHGRAVRRLLRRARRADLRRSRATCTNGEWSIVQGLDIDDFSRGRIDASVAELAEERDAVKELGLI